MDSLKIEWSAFTETDEDESGVDRYEVSILKLDDQNTGTIIFGWDTLGSNVQHFGIVHILSITIDMWAMSGRLMLPGIYPTPW